MNHLINFFIIIYINYSHFILAPLKVMEKLTVYNLYAYFKKFYHIFYIYKKCIIQIILTIFIKESNIDLLVLLIKKIHFNIL